VTQDPTQVLFLQLADVGSESDALTTDASFNDLFKSCERTSANEEHVGGVNLNEFLVWVLPSALGRNARGSALEDLEECLLHSFSRDVTCDRRVLGLARDLVYFVDVDDPGLCALDVVIRSLDQFQQDVLDVFADIAGLCQRGGVGDRKRHVEHAGQGLRQEGLSAASWTQQQDVGLGKFHIAVLVASNLNPFVVVVDRDRQNFLRLLLSDYVVVKKLINLAWLRKIFELQFGGFG